jgi:cytochrome c-type biogenesis protein
VPVIACDPVLVCASNELADPSTVGIPIAALAGAASFVSPCVLPLLPAYLSYVSGASAEMVTSGEASPRRLLIPTAVFVLGFTTVFVALGTSASLAGSMVQSHREILTRVGGVLVILMGLAFAGLLPMRWLYSERRLLVGKGGSVAGNYLLGLSFALGWTPCIGQTLGATLLIASQAETAPRGALLLAVYSLGLGIPFILSGLGVARLAGALRFFRKHQQAILRFSGGVLVIFGVLLFLDRVFVISNIFQRWMMAAGLDALIGI